MPFTYDFWPNGISYKKKMCYTNLKVLIGFQNLNWVKFCLVEE